MPGQGTRDRADRKNSAAVTVTGFLLPGLLAPEL